MKKRIAILLAVCLVFALASVAFAADGKETAAADALYTLGLFQGVGKDAEGKPIYELDRAPNRMEAVTMLVRLLGKEEEANAGTWEIPFTDVEDWAKPCVGYAYANGLTKGYDEKTFGGTDPVTAAQYLTFVLRAMGYSEADGDFRWDAAWELSDKLDITDGEYDASTASFDRGDVAKISWSALAAYVKGEGRFLGEKLLDEGVFTLEQSPEEEGQNPVMNWVGDYQCDRASAHVECEGTDSARIKIHWGSSAWEATEWVIVGKLDLDTLTIAYTGASKTNVTWDEAGNVVSEEVEYADGTGTIVFDEGTSFTWHEDQAEREDMVFEWLPAAPEEEEEGQNPVMNWIGKYAAGRPWAEVECYGKDSARITIYWSGSAAEHAEWEIIGKLDLDTLTIRYTDAVKKTITYTDEENFTETVDYEDGTGTIVFDEGLSFTWHEDLSVDGGDLVFRWAEAEPEEEGQNPVMNFIGEYQCDRAHAVVECEGTDSARIKIHWGGSAWDAAEWVIVGKLDLDTLTISSTGASKTIVTYDWDDEIESEEKVYEDGTGTIVFHDDGTFTWHEDQSEYGKDLVFKWGWTDPDEASGPVAAVLGDYAAGDYEAEVMDLGDNFLYILIYQDISDLQYIEWCIMDELDPETMTVTYTYASKEIYTFEDEDDYTADVEEVYDEGTGSIVFNEDGTFTWHEDQSETGEDVVLAIVPEG